MVCTLHYAYSTILGTLLPSAVLRSVDSSHFSNSCLQIMGKKKQEMSQVYGSNEFIFGERGGRGKHLSSFLKNLSLTGSSTRSGEAEDDVNRNIYGELSYGPAQSMQRRSSSSVRLSGRSVSGPVGSSYAHMGVPEKNLSLYSNQSIANSNPSLKKSTKLKYKDLDDDWDADLEKVDEAPVAKTTKSFSNSNPRYDNQMPVMVDSLYPDLIPVSQPALPDKDSMDYEDLKMKMEVSRLNQLNSKYMKFHKVLTSDANIDLTELRKLSWNGIPQELRALSWQLLLGYLPTNHSRQQSTLKRKRQEYAEGINTVSNIDLDEDAANANAEASRSELSLPSTTSSNRDKQIYHQIKIDVKRTNPTIKLYGYPATQRSLRKVLFLWAIRHPASGYVQGINDLVTPFYQIFLQNYLWQLQKKRTGEGEELFIPNLLDDNDECEKAILDDPQLARLSADTFDPGRLSSRATLIIEADTYWCLSRLLDNITDNYIHEQPGIIRQVGDLRNLISKIDVELLQHFDSEGIEFLQFSFRWMNCLLMREISIPLIIRMWDTYLSETPLGFNSFHVYVCAAFLIKFSNELKHKEFQEIILFLQNPPTGGWTERAVELMLSEAFIWHSLYKNASAHLR